MKIEIAHDKFIDVYECIEAKFHEWLDEHVDLLRLTDLEEDFIRATPILERSIEEVCRMYRVKPNINNYNVGLIRGVCSVQYDVFVTTYAWKRPMQRAIEKEKG